MGEIKFSPRHEANVVETTRGEDWVGFKTDDGEHHGTMTLDKWNSLEEAKIGTDWEVIPSDDYGEWPYDQL